MSTTKKVTITKKAATVYVVTIGARDAAGVPNSRLFVFEHRDDALRAYREEENNLITRLGEEQLNRINTYYANRAFCGAYNDADATFVRLEEKTVFESYEEGRKHINSFMGALK